MPRDYGACVFLQGCGGKGTADLNKNHLPPGCELLPGFLNEHAQRELLSQIRQILSEAPLFTPHMPRTGKPFSVAMSNCGPLGWLSDKDRGYRYEPIYPLTGKPWPPIPDTLITIWSELATLPRRRNETGSSQAHGRSPDG